MYKKHSGHGVHSKNRPDLPILPDMGAGVALLSSCYGSTPCPFPKFLYRTPESPSTHTLLRHNYSKGPRETFVRIQGSRLDCTFFVLFFVSDSRRPPTTWCQPTLINHVITENCPPPPFETLSIHSSDGHRADGCSFLRVLVIYCFKLIRYRQ